jgi:hypothetical protein
MADGTQGDPAATVEAVKAGHGGGYAAEAKTNLPPYMASGSICGEYLANGAVLPLVAEVRGELTLEPSGPTGGRDARRQLLAVVTALHAQEESQYPLRPFAPVSRHMTVSVESLESLDGKTSSPIARLDMTRERRYADGSLFVINQPRIDLEPVWIEQLDGVLDAFTRLHRPARQ